MKKVDIDLFRSTAELRRFTMALLEENKKLEAKIKVLEKANRNLIVKLGENLIDTQEELFDMSEG